MKIISAFILTVMLMPEMLIQARNDKTLTINSDLIPFENFRINKFKQSFTLFVFQKNGN
jgi:hypothetical protein